MHRRPKRSPTTFLVELIKPSHYDDDGYVIQWWRGFIPSNSLSVLYALALDAHRRRVLGEHVEIEIEVHDEINTVIPIKRIIRRFNRNDRRGIVCLVGVQTNQFARALDIARQLRSAEIQVAIGGFHVSGCVAMMPEMPSELKDALDLGVTLFAGEAEAHFDDLLRAAFEFRLEPLYDFTNDLAGLGGQPLPFLPRRYARRYAGWQGCFDTGRGCPFSCSFCTIINVQGRKSRARTADEVEQLIRVYYAEGVRNYFVTDDNFARNRRWEAILDRIIELREAHGFDIRIMVQVDTLCHKIPNFITKAARAGCERVFVGLESINPDSLKGISKGQNRITEYRKMLQAWHDASIITYAGYILGFPTDTPESIAREIEIVQRELPVDILQFFVLTPLPGSKDHADLLTKGLRMETDLNRFDTEHVTIDHPLMSVQTWQSIYRKAWCLYYTPEHIEILLRRAAGSHISPTKLVRTIFPYYASHVFEGVHPLQSGLFRRKVRTQRRHIFLKENPFVFYPRRLKEILGTYVPALWFFWKIARLGWRIERDPAAKTYADKATAPAERDDFEVLQLYREAGGRTRAVPQTGQQATRPAKLA